MKCPSATIIRLLGPGAAADCHSQTHMERACHGGQPPGIAHPLPTSTSSVCISLCARFWKCDAYKGAFPQEIKCIFAKWSTPFQSCGPRQSLGASSSGWHEPAMPVTHRAQLTVFPSRPFQVMLFFLDTWDYTVDIVPQSLNGWINIGKRAQNWRWKIWTHVPALPTNYLNSEILLFEIQCPADHLWELEEMPESFLPWVRSVYRKALCNCLLLAAVNNVDEDGICWVLTVFQLLYYWLEMH